MAFQISGTKTRTYVEMVISELELEAEYLVRRAELEAEKLAIATGITTTEATAVVLSNMMREEDFMKSWMNKNKKIVEEMHKQLVAQPIREFSKKDKKQKYLWVYGGSAQSCVDCVRMQGMEARTIDEWLDEGVGLPREGGTQCNVGCKCMLEVA